MPGLLELNVEWNTVDYVVVSHSIRFEEDVIKPLMNEVALAEIVVDTIGPVLRFHRIAELCLSDGLCCRLEGVRDSRPKGRMFSCILACHFSCISSRFPHSPEAFVSHISYNDLPGNFTEIVAAKHDFKPFSP